ncbi:MAG: NifB/NifX family molybdenum-iron cluster-binding protein [bacterium]
MGVRIGLASIDGSYVDQHFGSARYWQIYDIDGGSAFVETRKTQPTCNGHCEGGFEAQLEVLGDCDALFVARIGKSAALTMLQKGKRVFEATGPVAEIVEAVVEQGLLEDL